MKQLEGLPLSDRCPHCRLLFHTPPGEGTDGCACRGSNCGCRIKREAEAKS